MVGMVERASRCGQRPHVTDHSIALSGFYSKPLFLFFSPLNRADVIGLIDLTPFMRTKGYFLICYALSILAEILFLSELFSTPSPSLDGVELRHPLFPQNFDSHAHLWMPGYVYTHPSTNRHITLEPLSSRQLVHH
jgi:hypothetical protein